MPKRRAILVLVITCVAIAAALFFADPALACPNCKQALADGAADGDNTGKGFYYSILLMMSLPFLLATTFGGAIYYHTRKHNRTRA